MHLQLYILWKKFYLYETYSFCWISNRGCFFLNARSAFEMRLLITKKNWLSVKSFYFTFTFSMSYSDTYYVFEHQLEFCLAQGWTFFTCTSCEPKTIRIKMKLFPSTARDTPLCSAYYMKKNSWLWVSDSSNWRRA